MGLKCVHMPSINIEIRHNTFYRVKMTIFFSYLTCAYSDVLIPNFTGIFSVVFFPAPHELLQFNCGHLVLTEVNMIIYTFIYVPFLIKLSDNNVIRIAGSTTSF